MARPEPRSQSITASMTRYVISAKLCFGDNYVLDIASSAYLRSTKLWIVYEKSCGLDTSYILGQKSLKENLKVLNEDLQVEDSSTSVCPLIYKDSHSRKGSHEGSGVYVDKKAKKNTR